VIRYSAVDIALQHNFSTAFEEFQLLVVNTYRFVLLNLNKIREDDISYASLMAA
jgi:hypothetical protein